MTPESFASLMDPYLPAILITPTRPICLRHAYLTGATPGRDPEGRLFIQRRIASTARLLAKMTQ